MKKLIAIIFVLMFSVNTNCAYASDYDFDIQDQGDTKLCVYYSICSAAEYEMKQAGVKCPESSFSPQWLYEKTKKMYGEKNAYSYTNALEIAKQYGLCPKDIYEDDKKDSDSYAKEYKIESYTIYTKINTDSVNKILEKEKIVLLAADENVDDWKDGIVTKTETDDNYCHAFLLLGKSDYVYYDLSKELPSTFAYNEQTKQYDIHLNFETLEGFYECANSWGTDWGFNGFFYLHGDVIDNLVCEMYTININTENQNVVF